MLRGPGCCLGTLIGLVVGVVFTTAAAVGLWRLAPTLLEDLLDQAAHPVESRRTLTIRAPSRIAASPQRRPAPDAAGAARRAAALQTSVRERLRRIADDARRGVRIQKPLEFSEEEVRAALADPLGPLPDFPEEIRADLLPGRVRLSWKIKLLETPQRWQWSRRLAEVEATLDLAPRIEQGRLLCPVVSGRLGALPLTGRVARTLAPLAPSSPPLIPPEGVLVPSGIGSVEVLQGRLQLAPDRIWKESIDRTP